MKLKNNIFCRPGKPFCDLLAKVSGALVVLLGLSVIVGWHIESSTMIQIFPGAAEMTYNTALGFVLCGAGILFALFGFRRPGKISATIIGAIGALTLSEYLFDIDFGIDQLFMIDYINGKTSHPGRMAPNTALCFLLTSIAIGWLVDAQRHSRRQAISAITGAIVAALGLVALLGYFTGIEASYGWGNLSQMAVHTSIGFILCGMILLQRSSVVSASQEKRVHVWRATATSVGVLVLTVGLWQSLIINDRENIQKAVDMTARTVVSEIENHMQLRIQSLVRMGLRWERSGHSEKLWRQDAESYLEHDPALYAVEWVDATLHVRWAEPEEASKFAVGTELALDNKRADLLDKARQNKEPVIIGSPELVRGGEGFLVCVPLFVKEEFSGYIVGVYNYRRLFQSILHSDVAHGCQVLITNGDNVIFNRTDLSVDYIANYRWTYENNFQGAIWNIEVIPGAEVVSKHGLFSAETILLLGSLILVVMTMMYLRSQKIRQLALEAVTLNKELEEQISEREEAEKQSKEIIESSPNAIILFKDDGEMALVNFQAECCFNYSREELLGKSIESIIPEIFKINFPTHYDSPDSSPGPVTSDSKDETFGQKKNGQRFPAEIILRPIKFNESVFMLASIIDISERKRIEQKRERYRDELEFQVQERTRELVTKNNRLIKEVALREMTQSAVQQSEEKFKSLIDSAPDAIVAVTKSGKIDLVNRRAEEVFGYTKSEMIGQPIEMLLPESIRKGHVAHREGYAKAPSKRTMGERMPLKARRADGTEFPVEISLSPLKTDKGVLIMSVIRDVTERTNLEEQFRHAQKMEALGRLSGGVAHDFNNVLAAIMGYADLLRLQLDESDPHRKHAEGIVESARLATDLVRPLLAFSRKQVVEYRTLNLCQVVSNSQKLLRRLISEEIELVTNLNEEEVWVKADSAQIEQIVMNLAINARDAMAGGGVLSIAVSTVTISNKENEKNGVVGPGKYAVLTMSDTGHGMTSEVKAKIFEPFFTTKTRDKGTGLGLSTVYGIVKQNGGGIIVESQPGKGTTFQVLIPLVEDDTNPAERDSASDNEAVTYAGKGEVLVVEDEPLVRNVVMKILENCGYSVVTAEHADQALNEFKKRPDGFDLILTDVTMPGMSGPDLVSRLRQDHPNLKAIFMSGYSENSSALRKLIGPHTFYVQKPFTVKTLSTCVHCILDGDVSAEKTASSTRATRIHS